MVPPGPYGPSALRGRAVGSACRSAGCSSTRLLVPYADSLVRAASPVAALTSSHASGGGRPVTSLDLEARCRAPQAVYLNAVHCWPERNEPAGCARDVPPPAPYAPLVDPLPVENPEDERAEVQQIELARHFCKVANLLPLHPGHHLIPVQTEPVRHSYHHEFPAVIPFVDAEHADHPYTHGGASIVSRTPPVDYCRSCGQRDD